MTSTRDSDGSTAVPDEGAAALRRIFFALWPDAATAASIVRATKRAVRLSGGRPVAKERLHITLAFLGGLEPAALDRARSAAPVPTGAFDMSLDRIGHFEQSRVLWIAPRSVPPELTALERELWERLTERGFEREPRIYRPHVTLARRARAVPEEPFEPVLWHAVHLALVESVPVGRNAHYEVLERWPL